MITRLLERELINTTMLVMTLWLVVISVLHVALEIRERGWRAIYDRLGNQVAVAYLILVLGEHIQRAWGAVLIWHYREGGDWIALENRYKVAFVGAAIATIGAVCCARILSREIATRLRWEKRRHWGWIGSLIAAAIANVIVQLSH